MGAGRISVSSGDGVGEAVLVAVSSSSSFEPVTGWDADSKSRV